MKKMEEKVKNRSVKNLGINVGAGENDDWVNFDGQGNAQATEVMRQKLNGLKNGTTIEMEMPDDEHYTDYRVLKEPEAGGFGDREIVGLKELLNAAHGKGLTSVQTEIVTIDYEKKMAHVKAYAFKGDNVFHGSACKTADKMQGKQGDYWLETIESQAIARALRWLSNTGDVSDVEVNGEETKTEAKETKAEAGKQG